MRHQFPSFQFRETMAHIWSRRNGLTAVFTLAAIFLHLLLRFGLKTDPTTWRLPLYAALILGGTPLVGELAVKLFRREFGSDLLAGISIVTSVLLGEYLAGAIVVLMLSGGEALENYAVKNASSVLRALARRVPSLAHRKQDSQISDIGLDQIVIGDNLVIYPHEACPVDGVVVQGHGRMDESFLTGEPFEITKAPGATVLSGATNGESAITIRATKLPIDSRYAKIMEVMRASEQNRPRLRRLGDQLGAFYTPLALAVAILAWVFSGESIRFLSVLVIATPCPLLIAIPVAIIGSVSLAARRGIVVKNPAVFEQMDRCRVIILDKTGTLTYGEPRLGEVMVSPGFSRDEVLKLAASLEVYSKHPLGRAVLAAARAQKLEPVEVEQVSEPPGQGLRGIVSGRRVEITNRRSLVENRIAGVEHLPPAVDKLECCVAIDGRYAATFHFEDTPRKDGRSFIQHLGPRHRFQRVMIVSGDRESAVRQLAETMGITEIHAEQEPEQKLQIVRAETALAPTLYVGDGINDAPAMAAATIGVAIGTNSDVTSEAADVVVMDGELRKVDEFMHISHRMRSIALQSAVGGIVLSMGGMAFAAMGMLTPVVGAIAQEVIDILSVTNSLRAALPPRKISDFQ